MGSAQNSEECLLRMAVGEPVAGFLLSGNALRTSPLTRMLASPHFSLSHFSFLIFRFSFFHFSFCESLASFAHHAHAVGWVAGRYAMLCYALLQYVMLCCGGTMLLWGR